MARHDRLINDFADEIDWYWYATVTGQIDVRDDVPAATVGDRPLATRAAAV